MSRFPSTIYWKGCLFPTMHSCLLCHKLTGHICLSWFLDFLLCFTDLCACFYSFIFSLPQLCNTAWNQGGYDASKFVLFPQNCFGYFGCFMAPYKFYDCLFYFHGKCHRNFDRDCTESIDCIVLKILSSNPWAQNTFPFICIHLNFFHLCHIVFSVQVFCLS